jgi:hypothetical protein
MNKHENTKIPCWTEDLARDGSALLIRGNTGPLSFEGDPTALFQGVCWRGIDVRVLALEF